MKMILGIIVVVLLVAGGWYSMNAKSGGTANEPAVPDTSAREASAPSVSEVVVTKITDEALAQDEASLDAQLKAASTDAGVAAGFSDTPITQTE